MTLKKRLALTAAAVFAGVRAYGWWFHFSVGPVLGSDGELGAISAVFAIGALAIALR